MPTWWQTYASCVLQMLHTKGVIVFLDNYGLLKLTQKLKMSLTLHSYFIEGKHIRYSEASLPCLIQFLNKCKVVWALVPAEYILSHCFNDG